MKPIIIDAATIFDPARLIAVLASVDIKHSEVWVSQRYDHFKEKDFITGFGTEGKFALLPDASGKFKADPVDMPQVNDKLDPKSYMTGPKILRWAIKRGMVVPKDLYGYQEAALQLEHENDLSKLSEAIMLGPPAEIDIRAGKERTEEYLRRTGQSALGPEYAWRLEPYGIGRGLGIILAVAKENKADPFISHPNFRDNFSTHNYTYYNRSKDIEGAILGKDISASLSIDEEIERAKRLLTSPEPIDISEVAFYLEQRERINHITGIISASDELDARPKEIGIITSKALGTYAFDTFVFGGIPVATGLVSAYEISARFLKGKK
jgi:hypothetical protein